jgi:hypothetical protein
MRRRLAVVITALVAALAALPAPAAAAPFEVGPVPRCLELVPAAFSLDRTPTRLEVRVLLDGVSSARGQDVLRTARRSYGAHGISLVASYQSVSFSGSSADGLLDQSKNLFGGRRPAGVDVVYTLTDKDVSGDVAGLADCIGGVAFPANAFAMGENFTPDEGSLLGLPGLVNRELTAKVLAHELGHLLGGHHHYASCAEGLLTELGEEVSPCTLMINDVGLASFNFSQLNALVVRGHAQVYARP